MPDRDFTFEIEEHFGVISSRDDGWSKELNLVRWNGAAAKYDIREWDEHHEQMRRGVTLTLWEMRKLIELFVSRNNHAAVARGRAIEAERNARKIAARQKAGAGAPVPVTQDTSTNAQNLPAGGLALEEQQTMEGSVPPSDETLLSVEDVDAADEAADVAADVAAVQEALPSQGESRDTEF